MHRQFNSTAETFLSRMQTTFPNEPKIKVMYEKFMILKKANPLKPVELFIDNLQPFGIQILSKDEKFFKKQELVNNAETISGKMGLIKYWDSLPVQTKDTIWEFIQSLYILGMSSLDKKEELQDIINITNFGNKQASN